MTVGCQTCARLLEGLCVAAEGMVLGLALATLLLAAQVWWDGRRRRRPS